ARSSPIALIIGGSPESKGAVGQDPLSGSPTQVDRRTSCAPICGRREVWEGRATVVERIPGILLLDYPTKQFGFTLLTQADCFDWMGRTPEASIHAIVTDPPYGVKEYDLDQLTKRTNGKGGIWRIPPAFDGHTRAPLPRFTALNEKERKVLYRFFVEWS